MVWDQSCVVLSFDIFDTVLWRRVPRPTDVFAMLGARLRADGMLAPWVTDATFRRVRIAAEQHARASRGALGREVSLFDIWNAMPSGLFIGCAVQELVAVEVAIERELTVVDLDIAALIAAAHKQGVRVILVSDTYFTGEQLASLLERPELGPLSDVQVFRSHEHGVDKASGLWEVVLEDLGLRGEQVVHVGDNEIADHRVPAALGVRTVHYERIDGDFARVLERERQPLDWFGPEDPRLDPDLGDVGLTSLRARTLTAGSGRGSAAEDTAWRYGAAVLGPVLTGFAEWVARTAHESGIATVWCPMREGELLSELVRNAAAARGWAVQAKPLWLSRHVTSLAGLDRFDGETMSEFVGARYQLTVRQLLTMLHLRPGDVPAVAANLDNLLDHEDIVKRVSHALTETPHIRNRLAVTTTTLRERLLASLRASGALGAGEVMLVDLGWGGTIQRQLARVLTMAGVDVTVSGLYLATDERSVWGLMSGLRVEGYLGQAGHPREVVGPLVRSPEVMEQCVNALCGSLIDFAEGGEPVLGPHAGTVAQNTQRRAVRDGIVAFQGQWNRYVAASEGRWPELTTSARCRLADILTCAITAPTVEEAAVFSAWEHEDNFGSAAVTRLVPDDLVPAIPYLSPLDLNDLHMRDVFWPALIAASDPQLGAAARALSVGAVTPSMFESAGERFDTHLRFRTGAHNWHDGPRRRVRINHNGLSFARMSAHAKQDAISAVSLAIPGRPAVVRIDWIEGIASVYGSQNLQVLRWDQPDDFAGMTFADSTWLGGNLVEFHAPHSAVWLPMAAFTQKRVTAIQISVAFALLPQSRVGLSPRLPAAARLARYTGRVREEYQAKGAVGIAAGAVRVALRRLGSGR
ncbi:HAD family hydrolase [Actinocrispum wychmicini]|nr:HAD family hydrolase [Actinocrispum wychmicini]